jgi:hypothetical protein
MGRLEDYREEEAVVYDRGGTRTARPAQTGAAELPATTATLETNMRFVFYTIKKLLLSNMCFEVLWVIY